MRNAEKLVAPMETAAKSATIRVILVVIRRFSIFIQFGMTDVPWCGHRSGFLPGVDAGVGSTVRRITGGDC